MVRIITITVVNKRNKNKWVHKSNSIKRQLLYSRSLQHWLSRGQQFHSNIPSGKHTKNDGKSPGLWQIYPDISILTHDFFHGLSNLINQRSHFIGGKTPPCTIQATITRQSCSSDSQTSVREATCGWSMAKKISWFQADFGQGKRSDPRKRWLNQC